MPSTKLKKKTFEQEQKTLIRWINFILRSSHRNVIVHSLKVDLCDGEILVDLLESLISKKFTEVNRKPSTNKERLENISSVLEFLRDENVEINAEIDPVRIIDGDVKTILSILWSIAVHFFVAPSTQDRESTNYISFSFVAIRERLLQWIQNKIPRMSIINLSDDWKSGQAIAALIDALAPGLCSIDNLAWNESNSLSNTKDVMKLAKDWLGIQQFVSSDELNLGIVDERSMMLYLSQFPLAKLRSNAPLRVQRHSNKIVAYGPGIETTGNVVNVPTSFTVETAAAGNGVIDVNITNSNSEIEKADIRFNNDINLSYSISYMPKMVGDYKIFVTFLGKDIPGSPFRVNVVGQLGDASKVKISGHGLKTDGNFVGSAANFEIDTTDAGNGSPEVIILDPAGHKATIPVKLRQIERSRWQCEYISHMIGLHSVNIFFAGEPIPNSPFGVKISPVCDARKVKVRGRGIQSKGIRCGDDAVFFIHTEAAGVGRAEVKIVGPGGLDQNVTIKKVKEHVYECHYYPAKEGNYVIMVKYGKVEVPKAPFEIVVGPRCQTSIIAYGPGLVGGIAGYSGAFIVEMNGETGALGFSVAGPSQAEIECHDNGDGSALVRYHPTAPGEYAIHVLCDNDDISGSPFIAHIQPKSNFFPEHVVCSGRGIQPHGVILGVKTDFSIDTTNAGIAPLQINVQDSLGHSVPIETNSRNLHIIHCSYVPQSTLPHTVEINYGSVAAAESPYRVYISSPPDISRIKLNGKWFESTRHHVNEQTNFHVDATECDAADLKAEIVHEDSSFSVPVNIQQKDGIFSVEFTPTKSGKYLTSLLYGGITIPFDQKIMVSPAIDFTKMKILNLNSGLNYTNQLKEFIVDLSRTGAKIDLNSMAITIIDPNGSSVAHKLMLTGVVFEVLFTPKIVGQHKIHISYDDEPIPGSPYAINVTNYCDPSRVKVSGDGVIRGVTGQLSKFTIDTIDAGLGGLSLAVEGPAETKLKCIDSKCGSCKVEYTPTEAGEYEISIMFAKKHVPGSPFTVSVTNPVCPEKVRVFGPAIENQPIIAAEITHFNIDVSEAGPGLVAVTINNRDGVPADNVMVVNKGGGLYTVNFVTPNEDFIVVNVKFAHQNVKSSPFTLNITKRSNENNSNEMTKSCESKASPNDRFGSIHFNKLPVSIAAKNLKAEVKMPSGKIDVPLIEDNRDGTIRVQYDPREAGVHELILLHNGVQVPGSPFKFHVDSLITGTVTAYGPGLSGGKANEPNNFMISTKDAGGGGLSLSIEGPSKAKISYTDNKDGTVGVTYLPTEPGDYIISVRFGDKHIQGSPFTATIEGETRKRNQISIGSCSEVTLPGLISDDDLRTLNAIIQTPSGIEEPCFLKRLPSGNIGISFTPREVGEHIVNVKRMGIQIKNSPFKINVSDKEVGNSKKVKVHGDGISSGKTHVENNFVIDTRNAGYGGLSLSIEGPSKAEIKCLDQVDGTLSISYVPTEPGEYLLNVKFADHHIDGSPFTVKVSGEGNSRQRENIQQQTSAVPSNKIGSQCRLTFKMPGITSFDLSASVTSPNGTTQDAEVQEVEDGLYAVHFVPKEEGVHTVSVKYMELHIPGSPFQFTVGPFVDSGSHLVKAAGVGLEHGEVDNPCEFNVWTREAGAGSLAISVEGPSKAEINFKDRKDGSCNVSYVVKEAGDYFVSLKFNDRHIPESPFHVRISPAAGDAHKVEVAQFPQGNIQTNTPSQFLVRKNGARGDIDAKIVSPSNTEDDCFTQAIDSEETSVRFYPREEGIHSIHVKLNGVHIPGSPFRVKVGKNVADPALVTASGAGLKTAVTGQKSFFEINTLDAGTGTLSVTIDGPSKVSLDCSEIEEGYKVRYTPLLPGEHFISVKYNGVHIVSSPFRVECIGKKLVEDGGCESSNVTVKAIAKYSKGNKNAGPILPIFNADASKVTVKGMGIKKAFLGKQNQFTVNASEAGHSILFVGLYNPKGPCEEVQVKHTGKNTFTVNYYIRERSEYTLFVMWGQDHIPGSPFSIEVPNK